jgi:glycosyltransferase involved in cell wall biosynthesis
MTAKISIIIPVLNESAALYTLLMGISVQSLTAHEVIVIDAGSIDDSVSVVEKWAVNYGSTETLVRVMQNPGGMPGANRNLGITAAEGDWIAFIDAGIVPASNWLECLWVCAAKTKSKAIFGMCHFDADSAFEKAVCALSYGCKVMHPVLPASLFHKSVFDQSGLFREDLRAAEDILWVNEVVRAHGPKVICEDALVHYRHFPNSVSAVIQKWWVYPQNTVRAGVYSVKIWILPSFFGILILSLIAIPILGISLLLVYILIRGAIDPMRRSHSLVWCGSSPSSMLIAMWLGFLMDATKSLSILFAWLRR